MVTRKELAFIGSMGAAANLLGLVKLALGPLTIHMFQFPIILTGLVLGPFAGGTVGLVGAIIGAFTLAQPNPYVIIDNAILGFFTGLLYSQLKRLNTAPFMARLLSISGAFALQAPFAFLTDVYLMLIPVVVVQLILVTVLVEDMISILVCHLILIRVDLARLLK